jgi:glycosyltransferase involved in cell wall biosynthesis
VAGSLLRDHLPRAARDAAGVTFSGPLDDLRPELERADVAIVPVRLGGGTKLKVFEALAAGLPVVAHPAAADDCCPSHGVTCRSDAASYAEAIATLLEDPDLRRAQGASALAHAREAHDWDRLAGAEERWLDEARTAAM